MDFVRGIPPNILDLTSYVIVQNRLDKTVVFCTQLMDPFKVFTFLTHNFKIAKLQAYGGDSDGRRAIKSYLSNQHQRKQLKLVFISWFQNIIRAP